MIGANNSRILKEKAEKGKHLWQDPEFIAAHKVKLSQEGWAASGGAKMKGKLWWNNGTKQTRTFECPGEGWNRGRISKRKS
jgi:hypothetical protein